MPSTVDRSITATSTPIDCSFGTGSRSNAVDRRAPRRPGRSCGADSGRVLIDGIDVRENPRAALSRIGCLSDSRGLYPRLTARENIIYYGRLQGLSHAAAVKRTGVQVAGAENLSLAVASLFEVLCIAPVSVTIT